MSEPTEADEVVASPKEEKEEIGESEIKDRKLESDEKEEKGHSEEREVTEDNRLNENEEKEEDKIRSIAEDIIESVEHK